MMTCRQYVFSLTSGLLDEASTRVRLEAKVHRWMCPYCRAFTKNDQALGQILAQYREQGQALNAIPDSRDQASDQTDSTKR